MGERIVVKMPKKLKVGHMIVDVLVVDIGRHGKNGEWRANDWTISVDKQLKGMEIVRVFLHELRASRH